MYWGYVILGYKCAI